MQKLSLKSVATALGCHTNSDGYITDVVTDSRLAHENCIFVAIIGEQFDGNLYAQSALSKGAKLAVVSRPIEGVSLDKLLIVDDTKTALVKIGGLYRDNFNLPIVGVTGSVGKTTTKEFIHTVLSSAFNTHKNIGNKNNEIGVPETLFALEADHQAAVIEMGMCLLGEIALLTSAVKPLAGVITVIGVSHMEALGSQENILKAKLELAEGLAEGSPLFLCGDDKFLNTYSNNNLKIYRYGLNNPENDIFADNIVTENDHTTFDIHSQWGDFSAYIPAVGNHNVQNALAAFGVGCVFGMNPATACEALKNYSPSGMRQKFVAHNGFTVVEDCYNCSPDSLKAATDTISKYPCLGRRILVVGDMLELGKSEIQLHKDCGEYITNSNIQCLYGVGELTAHLVDSCNIKDKKWFENKEELSAFLKDNLVENDVVWFKASRGMQLEEVINAIYRG